MSIFERSCTETRKEKAWAAVKNVLVSPMILFCRVMLILRPYPRNLGANSRNHTRIVSVLMFPGELHSINACPEVRLRRLRKWLLRSKPIYFLQNKNKKMAWPKASVGTTLLLLVVVHVQYLQAFQLPASGHGLLLSRKLINQVFVKSRNNVQLALTKSRPLVVRQTMSSSSTEKADGIFSDADVVEGPFQVEITDFLFNQSAPVFHIALPGAVQTCLVRCGIARCHLVCNVFVRNVHHQKDRLFLFLLVCTVAPRLNFSAKCRAFCRDSLASGLSTGMMRWKFSRTGFP
jgi:hypothetical protein